MLVRELRVVDGETPLQILASDLGQPPVGLRVDARDEEAGDRGDAGGIPAICDEPLEAAQVRLRNRCVALEREDERDVDRPARRDRVLDRTEPRLRGGDLHEQVLAIDALGESGRLLEGRVAVVGEVGIDLEGDEAVDAACPLEDGMEEIACPLDVLDREREEHLACVVRPLELGAELAVVPLAGRQCLLEDRRIRRDADHRVLADEAVELTFLEPLARQRVHPDAHAQSRELVQATSHAATLPLGRSRRHGIVRWPP